MTDPPGISTVLFTDVVGSTRLRTEKGDAVADRLLGEAEAMVAEKVAEHSGKVVKSLGDGQLVLFSSPRNAVACAVSVQEALSIRNKEHPNEQVALRMGVNAGEVSRRAGDVLGEAVNAAARITDKAKAGEILVSDVVRRLVGTLPDVTFRDRGRLTLKGFQGRWPIHEVVWNPDDLASTVASPRTEKRGSSPRARRPSASRAPLSADPALEGFVDREAEAAALTAAIDQCITGRGALVTLEGQAGIGKTRLASVAAAHGRSAGMAVAWGRSWEAGGAPAFWLWTQALRELVEQLEPDEASALSADAPKLARILPELGEGDPESTGSFELFDAASRFVKGVARRRPVLLILDDLHAADEDSLGLIEFLGRDLQRTPLLILAAFADDTLRPNDPAIAALEGIARFASRLQLKAFDETAVGALYRVITGKDAAEPILSVLFEATEGLPYFIDQAVRLLEAEGSLRRPDHSLGFRVPRGARAILRRRLEKLPDESGRLLAVAAVVGREFDATTLREVSGLNLDQVYDLLGEAVAGGVVREISSLGHFSFAHVLLRETLYEELAMSDRMKLHRAVAEVLERRLSDDDGARIGEVAHHYFKAAQAGDKKKTFGYTIQAAERAAGAAAHSEAIRLYERALKVANLGGVAPAQRSQAEKALKALHDAVKNSTDARSGDAGEALEGSATFTRSGDYWTLEFGGTSTRVRDSKGMRYLGVLLGNPHSELHVLELASWVATGNPPSRTPGSRPSFSDLGAILDDTAKAAYRARLDDIESEMADAEAIGDSDRADKLAEERAALAREIAGAVGLGGRDRKAAPESERARLAVSKAIRSATSNIEAHHQQLADHLRRYIRTGTYCSYSPEPSDAPTWTATF